jgi:hypothetical protein
MKCRFLFLFLLFSSRLPAQDFIRFYQDSADLQVAMHLLADSGQTFWLGGYKATDGANTRAWMYKVNQDGDVLNCIFFPGLQTQVWAGMAAISDGIAAVVGLQEFSGETRYFLGICNENGLQSWRYLPGLDNAALHDTRNAKGNRLLISGFKGADGIAGNDFFLARVNADSARTDWIYFEGYGPNDHISTCKELADGSTLFCGTVSEQGNYNPCMGKLDSSGQLVWLNAINTIWNDGSQKFEVAENGDIWLVGESSTSAGSFFDTEIFRLNADGQLLWQQWLGSPGQDAAFVIQRKSLSPGFWVAGYSNALSGGGTGPISPFLMALDSSGNSTGETFWPLDAPSPVYDMLEEGDSLFYFCGTSANSAYLMRRKTPVLSPVFVLNTNEVVPSEPKDFCLITDWEDVSAVYDLFGRLHWQKDAPQNGFRPKTISGNELLIIQFLDGRKRIVMLK